MLTPQQHFRQIASPNRRFEVRRQLRQQNIDLTATQASAWHVATGAQPLHPLDLTPAPQVAAFSMPSNIVTQAALGTGQVGGTARDWAVLVLAIAMVFTAEFINTSIEAVVYLASPVHHPLAKVGKDVGAGAVLVAAVAAELVGFLIMGPPLWARLAALFAGN